MMKGVTLVNHRGLRHHQHSTVTAAEICVMEPNLPMKLPTTTQMLWLSYLSLML